MLLILALPIVAPAVTSCCLTFDRHFDAHFFDAAQGGYHRISGNTCSGFFGHPEVYIVILPGFGIMSDIISTVLLRKRSFGYHAMVFATVVIAFLASLVWVHHMFTVGPVPIVVLSFFMISPLLIAVPTGIKIFNWIATMWRGKIRVTTSLYCVPRLHYHLCDRRDHRHLWWPCPVDSS